jgi:hypothetical protein
MHQNNDNQRSMDMESAKYHKLLLSLPILEVSEQMPLHILARISESRRHDARVKVITFGVVSTGALLTMIPLATTLGSDVTHSALSQYVSIIFTDSDVFIVAWKDILLGIIETIPLTEITLSIGVLFIFLYSIKIASKNTRGAFLQTQLI